MDEKDSLFKLRWDNQGSLLGSVASLFNEQAFIDTTIFTDGKLFKAHRLLLSASSPYLKHVLQSVPGEHHSVLLLPHVNSRDFEHVLKFIYDGEIKINQKDLKSFLQVARVLKIKGMDFEDEDPTEDPLSDDNIYGQDEHSKLPEPDHSRPSSAIKDSEDKDTNNDHSGSSIDKPLPKSLQLERTNRDDYENSKEISFLSGDEEDDLSGENQNEILERSPPEQDNDSLGLPLLPEVSLGVESTYDDMKHSIPQDIQITSRSWSVPHSSLSNQNRGTYGSTKPYLKKGYSTAGEGILMRMMKEPLKSSIMATQSHVQYELDDTGQRRAKRYVQCTSCSKVLSSLSALKRHMEDVHCARIQGKCLICGRVYSSRNSLLTHVYSAHKRHHDYKAVARIIRESDFETFASS